MTFRVKVLINNGIAFLNVDEATKLTIEVYQQEILLLEKQVKNLIKDKDTETEKLQYIYYGFQEGLNHLKDELTRKGINVQ